MLETSPRQETSRLEVRRENHADPDRSIPDWFGVVLSRAGADLVTVAFAVLVPLVLYAAELTSFSLSIDEEWPGMGTPADWVAQGRWGMALLNVVMPPVQQLPVIATALFCAGLSVSALLFSCLLTRNRFESLVFIAFFVANPLWPHLAEFNTLSWGMGITLVALGLCAHAIGAGSLRLRALAVVLLAFSLGVYQSAVFLFAPLALAVSLPNRVFLPGPDRSGPEHPRHSVPVVRTLVNLAVLLGAAVGVYLSVELVTLAVTGEHLTYVDGFVRIGDYLDPATGGGAVRNAAGVLAMLATGLTGAFLGRGFLYLGLCWLGALVVPVRRFRDPRTTGYDRRAGALVLVGTAGAVAGPVLLAAGSAPFRSQIGIPMACALTALAAARGLPWRRTIVAATCLALFVSWWITTALFTADQVARDRDATMATQIMLRMQEMGVGSRPAPEPFAVIGLHSHPEGHVARRSQIFGESFFEHAGDHQERVANYLWLRGQTGLSPIAEERLLDRPASADQVRGMPVWPAAGSLDRVNGVLVLKLGPPAGDSR